MMKKKHLYWLVPAVCVAAIFGGGEESDKMQDNTDDSAKQTQIVEPQIKNETPSDDKEETVAEPSEESKKDVKEDAPKESESKKPATAAKPSAGVVSGNKNTASSKNNNNAEKTPINETPNNQTETPTTKAPDKTPTEAKPNNPIESEPATKQETTRLPNKAICNDGTISYQDTPSEETYRGMCSGHGGIKEKLGRVP